jgi:hypothetical protein
MVRNSLGLLELLRNIDLSVEAAYPVELLSNHKYLEYFIIKKLPNQRQPWWSESLTHLNYQIVYRPGQSNCKPDALTRRLGNHSEGGDERLKYMEQVVLKPQNLPRQFCLLADSPPIQGHPSITDLLDQTYKTDV